MTAAPTDYWALKPGDRYRHYNETGAPVVVTVLTASEPWREPFGRAGFGRLWARRDDTGAEGYVCHGPGGTALLLTPGVMTGEENDR